MTVALAEFQDFSGRQENFLWYPKHSLNPCWNRDVNCLEECEEDSYIVTALLKRISLPLTTQVERNAYKLTVVRLGFW